MPLLESWQLESMGQIALAGLLGGLVGLERHYRGRAAGFRTHLLVSVGCCLVMIMSHQFARLYAGRPVDVNLSPIRLDPARLAYSVMGGIGFLGAGAIIKSGLTIRGLTTAASLWCIAAIGMACGMGLYVLAIYTALLVFLTLVVLRMVEAIVPGHWYKEIRVTCADRPDEVEKISDLLEKNDVKITDVTFDRNLAQHTVTITFDVRYLDKRQTPRIYRLLSEYEGLHSISVD